MILLSLGELALLGTLWWSGLRQIEGINKSVNDLSDLKDPSPYRVALMGHLGKIHLGLQGYLRSPDALLLEQVVQSRKDFEASLPEFAKENPKLFPKVAMEEIARVFTMFNESIDRALEANTHRMQTRSTLDQNFTRIVFLIDHNLKPIIRSDQPYGDERKDAILNVENLSRAWQQNLVKAWEQPSHAATELTFENDSRGDSYLNRYAHMELLTRERKVEKEIQTLWQANSNLARESFALEQVVTQAVTFMDSQRTQVIQALNKYLPAMPPAELQARKDGFVQLMRFHGVVVCLFAILGLASLRFSAYGVYRLARGEPVWKTKSPSTGTTETPKVLTPKDPTLEMDLKGLITQWTDAAEALYGYTASELKGKSISKLFESDYEISRLYKDLQNAPHATFETTHKAKDGVAFRVKIEFRFLKDSAAKASTIGLVCTRR